VERQQIKKHPSISRSSIFNFIVAKNPYKQSDVEQQQILEDFSLLVV
jgi:hypothetical protein